MKYLKTFESFRAPLTESHFKPGDRVKCIASGMSGRVVSLDKPDGEEDEKYYNVELESGEMKKYAPEELVKESVANESVLTEGKVKQFEMDLESMIKDIKRGMGWIDPEYVGDSWENSNDTIDFRIVKAEVFKRLLDAGVLYFSDDSGEEKGKAVKSSDLPAIMKMYESFNEGAMADIDKHKLFHKKS